MGFCRHCGNIVSGARCACGGPPVAPVVSFNRSETPGSQDKWSKTYVSAERCTMAPARNAEPGRISTVKSPAVLPSPIGATASLRRFPRPKSMFVTSSTSLNSGIADHITHATSQSTRPPSPLKMSTTLSDAENDILPSFLPHEPSLSKVYGSVLQPKDTLTMHSCAICEVVFPPDATIYPNPSSSPLDKPSFLCRPCFTTNGGSKGVCPACSRPVLALKAEGAFIHSGSNYWHKRCYNCAGCFKNIGDAPMVDLLGRPSCVDCFDSCLKRDHPATPKKNRTSSNSNSPSFSNPGGLNTSYGPGRKSRESSPALEELEQRLGLGKSRENSPAVIDSGRALSSPRNLAKLSSSQLNSSSDKDSSRSQCPKSGSQDIFDEVSSIRMHKSPNTFTKHLLSESSTRSDLYREKNNSRTPLASTQTISSDGRLLSHSPSSSPVNHSLVMAESSKSQNNLFDPSTSVDMADKSSDSITTSLLCDKCGKPILRAREGGQFVTIPGADENSEPKAYHSDCFKCAICDKAFNDSKKGQASFINSRVGPCHPQCIPPEPLVTQKQSSSKGLPEWAPTIPHDLPTWTSNKPSTTMPPPLLPFDKSQAPLPSPHSPSKPAFPRFGGQTSCPGCHKSVSLMERGVVPGPQGSKWHASCLVCGGKKEITRTALLGRVPRDEKKGEPGCGKKLDSAAKIDGEGGVWCRECLLLLGVGGSPQTSPLKSPLSPVVSVQQGKVDPQFTGTTTLARQFTGNDAILRQLTGGGLSPTRSISPTKQLGFTGSGGMRPRPKSVIGHVRNTNSVDSGRGMYLVRQMTGTTTSESCGEFRKLGL